MERQSKFVSLLDLALSKFSEERFVNLDYSIKSKFISLGLLKNKIISACYEFCTLFASIDFKSMGFR